ncbi:hypothetical protein [Bradyrhizobium sp. RDM4]|uniref:hypothetical protein n=1 Tax=Bradyrhizobium sp. RDM4 TaxID=3378765 RepID=UPI0038FD3844
MSYIQGDDRGQAALLPAAVEDYVAAVASGQKIVGPSEIADEAARLDRRIADYLATLDDADGAEKESQR